MQKLHLVGFTTDQTGLILSARKGARSGGYTLVLDDALAQAVDDLRARQAEEAESAGAGRSDRVESRLPIGEIQARLRRGKSLKDVAKDAGVEPEWVERFAAPVFAEQAGVIAKVQALFYKRARLGPSGLRVGDAVRRNLAERGVVMSPDEFNAAWRTHQRPDGRWIVAFTFTYRGASKTLKFEVRPNGDIVASDPLTAQMAFVAPPKRPNPRPRPVPAAPEDHNAKRAVVTTGFRPDPPVKAASRPGKEREKAAAAMTKAAARRAAEGERAAARKARERERMLARREREAAAEALRRSREIAAKAREAAAAARLAQAEQAERERAAAAVVAARQADREAARRAARLKVKAASKTVAAKKAAASKAGRAKSVAKPASPTRSTDRAAASSTGSKSPAKPPRPSAAARVEAPPPRRAESADRTATTTPVRPKTDATPKVANPDRDERDDSDVRAVAADRREARRLPGAGADRTTPSTRPVALPERRQTDESAGQRPAGPSRPQFRTGFAAPAAEEEATKATPATSDEPPANGVAPRRPPGLRRTRPLRAN